MNELEIRNIVERVLNRYTAEMSAFTGDRIPLEVSARHVHLTREAVETLFGKGATLCKVRALSQPGEFLSDKRVKLVTQKGEFDNVAVLGPERKSVQAELSATDCRALGIQAPVNLSGDLSGAADIVIMGENGVLDAKGSVIIAKAHLHFTPSDATKYGVSDGQSVGIKIHSARPVTLHDVSVRVRDNFSAALHIDFDEANACLATPETEITIIK